MCRCYGALLYMPKDKISYNFGCLMPFFIRAGGQFFVECLRSLKIALPPKPKFIIPKQLHVHVLWPLKFPLLRYTVEIITSLCEKISTFPYFFFMNNFPTLWTTEVRFKWPLVNLECGVC